MKREIIKFILIIFAFLIISETVLATEKYLTESNQWQVNLSAIHFSSLAIADVDNDGLIDLAAMGSNTDYHFWIYTNNGTSLMENKTWGQNLTQMHYGSLKWADIDNNGNIDMIAMGCSDGGGLASACNTKEIFVYTNNGTSLMENKTWGQNLTPTWNGAIDIGDVDSDGDLDLMITGQSNIGILSKIYLNNGTSFEDNIQWGYNLTPLWKSSGQFGDIDNDGDLDLILIGDQGVNSGIAKIYLNNGSSLLEDTTWQQNVGGEYHTAMSLGDYDNDGDLDLTVIGKTSTDHHRVYKNDNTTFVLVEQELQNLGGVYRGSVGWFDYNNSGYLDLMASGYEGATTLYANNGTNFSSVLQDPESQIINLIGSSFIWGDLDNDTDLDIIITGYQKESINNDRIKVYINNVSIIKNNSIPYAPATNFSNTTLSNGDIFLSWGDGSDNQTSSNGLYYNLRVGTTSAGNQIDSGIYGGSSNPYGGYFGNMMQRKNITLKASRFQVGTTYYWSVQTIDTALAKSEWSAEKTFNLTSDFTPPTITLNIPADNLVTNATSITFNATVVDDYNLTNVTLYGNWSGGWHKNTTNSSGINNTNYIFRNNLTEGTHLWGIRACDNTANCIGTNQTFRIDITSPIVNLISPSNGSSLTTSNTVNFTYNVSDLGISNCSLMINGLTNVTNTSILINQTQNFTANLPNGNYNWSIRCTDQANNVNFTGNYSLTVSYTAPSEDTGGSSSSGSSGGGGGGGGTASLNIVSRIIPSVIVGENQITFTETEKKNTGIEEITINSNLPLNNAKIIVEKLRNKPADVEQDPRGDVYSYLRFDKTILTDNSLESAIIKFTVNRSWVLENNYQAEDIALSHYTTSWEKLPTKFLSSDPILYHYEAKTKGFSYFAVTAESNLQNRTIITIDNKTVIEEPNESIKKQEKLISEETGLKSLNYKLIWFMAAALIFTTIIALLTLKKKPKTNKK